MIDKQPPYVLKTQTKLTASVRLLVGAKLNLQMNLPEVSVNIVSQEQARNVMASCRAAAAGLDTPPLPHTVCGEILNNRKALAFASEDNTMQAAFKNMSLKKIKRSGSKAEQVTEEKFALVFQTSFNIGGEDRVYTVQAMSLPVVVVVHGNQVCSAEATILWDYAFAPPDRVSVRACARERGCAREVLLMRYFVCLRAHFDIFPRRSPLLSPLQCTGGSSVTCLQSTSR